MTVAANDIDANDIIIKNVVYTMLKQYENDIILPNKLIVQIIKVKYTLRPGSKKFEVSCRSLVMSLLIFVCVRL